MRSTLLEAFCDAFPIYWSDLQHLFPWNQVMDFEFSCRQARIAYDLYIHLGRMRR